MNEEAVIGLVSQFFKMSKFLLLNIRFILLRYPVVARLTNSYGFLCTVNRVLPITG